MDAIVFILAIVPYDPTVVRHCAEIEHNVCCHECGDVWLDQLIFRDPWEIRDWRMTNKVGLPRYDWERRCWVSQWIEDDTLIEVRAAAYTETHSSYDREWIERDWLPESARRRVKP